MDIHSPRPTFIFDAIGENINTTKYIICHAVLECLRSSLTAICCAKVQLLCALILIIADEDGLLIKTFFSEILILSY